MLPGRGKQKGNSFERLCCKQLGLWVTDGKRDDIYWRTAMSGGRATVRAKKGKQTKSQCGDISAVAPEGNDLLTLFMIECKCVRDLAIKSAMFNHKGLLVTYWKELVRAADKQNKAPMLIAKENRCDTFVMMLHEDRHRYIPIGDDVQFRLCNERVVIISLKRFLANPYENTDIPS